MKQSGGATKGKKDGDERDKQLAERRRIQRKEVGN